MRARRFFRFDKPGSLKFLNHLCLTRDDRLHFGEISFLTLRLAAFHKEEDNCDCYSLPALTLPKSKRTFFLQLTWAVVSHSRSWTHLHEHQSLCVQ